MASEVKVDEKSGWLPFRCMDLQSALATCWKRIFDHSSWMRLLQQNVHFWRRLKQAGGFTGVCRLISVFGRAYFKKTLENVSPVLNLMVPKKWTNWRFLINALQFAWLWNLILTKCLTLKFQSKDLGSFFSFSLEQRVIPLLESAFFEIDVWWAHADSCSDRLTRTSAFPTCR